MKIAVYGTGGVGGYFGGRLAEAGAEVSFIARGEHLTAIRENGLVVESINGDFRLKPANATDNPADIGPVDFVLVCVKSWQLPAAMHAMQPLLGPETAILSLLNGVESVDQLGEVFGPERVVGGVAKIFSFIGRPGVIQHVGQEPTLILGTLDGRQSRQLERLVALFHKARVAVELAEDIRVELWEKFLFITGWGGLGAISRAPIGVTREMPATRQVIEACLQETEAVARAAGIALPADIQPRTWTFINALPPHGTSSLQRDIAAGRPSELDAWNGAVVRMGRRFGVATPTHDLIVSALQPLEQRARGEIQF